MGFFDHTDCFSSWLINNWNLLFFSDVDIRYTNILATQLWPAYGKVNLPQGSSFSLFFLVLHSARSPPSLMSGYGHWLTLECYRAEKQTRGKKKEKKKKAKERNIALELAGYSEEKRGRTIPLLGLGRLHFTRFGQFIVEIFISVSNFEFQKPFCERHARLHFIFQQ